METITTLTGLRCQHCGSLHIRVKGTKGALGNSLATGLAFGAVGNLVAGKNAASNTATEPLEYKCLDCGKKFVSMPLVAKPDEIMEQPCKITFMRQKSFVGAAVPQIVYLNGMKVAPVKNGSKIKMETRCRNNVIFVTDQYGVAFDEICAFEAHPGAEVFVEFKRKFVNFTEKLPQGNAETQSQTAEEAGNEIPTATEQEAVQSYSEADEQTNITDAPTEEPQKETASETPIFDEQKSRVIPTTVMNYGEKKQRPELAFRTALLAAASFLLLVILQLCFNKVLQKNYESFYVLCTLMLAAASYLIVQPKAINKVRAAAAGIIFVVFESVLSRTLYIIDTLTMSSNTELVTVAFEGILYSIPRNIIITAVILGGTVAGYYISRRKEKLTRLFTIGTYFVVNLILLFVNHAFTLANFFMLHIDTATMFLAIMLFSFLCNMRTENVRLKIFGRIWSWICLVGSGLSVVTVFASGILMLVDSSFKSAIGTSVYTFSFLWGIFLFLGYLLLLRKKRVGLYFIIIGGGAMLWSQLALALNYLVFNSSIKQAGPLLISTLASSVNPLVAALTVNAGVAIEKEQPTVVQNFSGFHKFTAIFNLIAGLILFIPLIAFANQDRPEIDWMIIVGSIATCVFNFAFWSVLAQHSSRRKYRAWMKVLNIILFGIVAFILVGSIIGNIA